MKQVLLEIEESDENKINAAAKAAGSVKKDSWNSFFKETPAFDDDFLADRDDALAEDNYISNNHS